MPGGALADKLGAKNVMTATLLLSGLCCIAVPLLAGPFGLMGVWCAIALMGAFQGPMFPTSSVLLCPLNPDPDPDPTLHSTCDPYPDPKPGPEPEPEPPQRVEP